MRHFLEVMPLYVYARINPVNPGKATHRPFRAELLRSCP